MRAGLCLVLALCTMMLSGCAKLDLDADSIVVVSEEEASLNDAIMVLRVSSQKHAMSYGATDGFVVIVDAHGNAQAVNIGAMDTAKLVWTEAGVFAGSLYDEVLLTDEGMQRLPRGELRDYEMSRFATSDGSGFIAVYNIGFGEQHYLSGLATGDTESVTSWEFAGYPRVVSQCGDVVVAMISESLSGVALTQTEHPEWLIQLYPQPDDLTAPMTPPYQETERLTTSTLHAPCVEDTVYALGVQDIDHELFEQDPELALANLRTYLRSWNIHSGEHRSVQLSNEDGSPFVIDPDHVMGRPVTLVDGNYLWVTRSGQVLAADLSSGVVAEKLRFSLPGEWSQFVLTEHSLFVLDLDSYRKPGAFSHYDLATGKQTQLFTMPATLSTLRDDSLVLRSMVLRPEWVSELETHAL